MDHQKAKRKRQLRRRLHVRRTITGTPERPRLSVFRSNLHIHAQLIDDLSGVTLASASSVQKGVRGEAPNGGNQKVAALVGAALAEAAKSKGITKAAFDRGHYKYHGRIKALAEAATKAGLVCTKIEEKKKAPPPEAAKPAGKEGKEGKEKGKEGKEKKEKPAKPQEPKA